MKKPINEALGPATPARKKGMGKDPAVKVKVKVAVPMRKSQAGAGLRQPKFDSVAKDYMK
jgi:hypothetical protein